MGSRYPIPPGVVARVVQTAANPDASIPELARLIDKDAVLSTQVLKRVNSATFGLRARVGSVDRAVAVMGLRSVRNLVLTLGVRDLVPVRSIGEFPLDVFWESSLRRGAAAMALAERVGMEDPQEFFTLGVCQDVGTMMRLLEDPGLATRLIGVQGESSDARLEVERAGGKGHDEAGYEMFSEWRFPEEFAVPIRFHHRPEACPEQFRVRARIAHAAEAIADLSAAADKISAVDTATARLGELGLDGDLISALVGRCNDLVEEFAELFGLNVELQPTFEDIIAAASQGLAHLATSYEEMTRRLEGALAEQQRVAESLQLVNAKLSVAAGTDDLTGLPNRRAFNEMLGRELAVAQRQRSPLSLILVDVDRFKQVNDAHGHAAGDLVLQQVGRALRECLRASDVVARYGGEEFAAILPFTDAANGATAAERMRVALEAVRVRWEDQELRVTASFGGATLESVTNIDLRLAEDALQCADEALYAAKEQGRNRVCWAGKPARQAVGRS